MSRIMEAIGELCAGLGPLPVRFAGEAMFGPKHDVPVQLVESAPVVSLHGRLADRLESMPGFDARDPAYWRAGYRPHMTRVPSLIARDGDREYLRCVAIAAMTDSHATLSVTWMLASSQGT
jgi:hypothetical protein